MDKFLGILKENVEKVVQSRPINPYASHLKKP